MDGSERGDRGIERSWGYGKQKSGKVLRTMKGKFKNKEKLYIAVRAHDQDHNRRKE